MEPHKHTYYFPSSLPGLCFDFHSPLQPNPNQKQHFSCGPGFDSHMDQCVPTTYFVLEKRSLQCIKYYATHTNTLSHKSNNPNAYSLYIYRLFHESDLFTLMPDPVLIQSSNLHPSPSFLKCCLVTCRELFLHVVYLKSQDRTLCLGKVSKQSVLVGYVRH